MSSSSGYLKVEQLLKQTWTSDGYEERITYLRRKISTWFNLQRHVGGGGAILFHVVSGGLPNSRHPNSEAAQLQTRSAKRRLHNYQELIETISYGLGVPVCLPELSIHDIALFRAANESFGDVQRKCSLPHNTFMSDDNLSMLNYHREWNPVLRLDEEGKVYAESIWDESIERKLVSTRAMRIINTLQEKRQKEVCPVMVIYTEDAHNFLPSVHSWNAQYLMARQTEKVVEYIKIMEPW